MLNLDIKNHDQKFEIVSHRKWDVNHAVDVLFVNKVPKSVLDVASYIKEQTIPTFDGKGGAYKTYKVTLVLECDLNNPHNDTTQKQMDEAKDIVAQLLEKLA